MQKAHNAGGLQQEFWTSYPVLKPTHLEDSKHHNSNALLGFRYWTYGPKSLGKKLTTFWRVVVFLFLSLPTLS